MSRLRDLVRGEGDHGAALPFITVMLVLLIGMAAFAIDLGWIFLNAARVQRAADASALAGVVYLPGDTANVSTFAVNGAQANGYSIGSVNGSPTGTGGPDELAWQALADNKLEVTLDSTIATFFLRVLGFDSFDIRRVATAEYIKPVPLGSPTGCFGLGPGVQATNLNSSGLSTLGQCQDFSQNFWGAVNGRRTAKQHGDPYLVTCAFNCPGSNPEFDPEYYYYGIDVPVGKTSVDIYLYDGGFYDRSGFAETGDEESLTNSANGGTHTTFRVFQPDGTPLIARDNNVAATCSIGGSTLTIDSESNASSHENSWFRLCRLDASGGTVPAGIYILRVTNGGSSIGGSNSYAVLAASSPTSGTPANNPRVYAIDTMSIFTNDVSGTATVYLAEITPEHAGKILELRFFDPGEGAGTTFMSVRQPGGALATGCAWSVSGPNVNGCTLRTTVNGTAQYNGQWVEATIPIPDTYTCDDTNPIGCFWTMRLELNTQHDRTTWEARVIGNPVRLTPNE
ncbi:MAG: pilus assembly protein TadG-related protein [Actinobacteria bacterium]|nr:pilus assembly protein TadG-related protein [Actinomycetota bacterium]